MSVHFIINWIIHFSRRSCSTERYQRRDKGSLRWKQNIQEIDNALDKVLAIRGVYFDWDEEHGGQHDMGFIAEEVGEQIPEIVSYEKDGQYATGIDYGA